MMEFRQTAAARLADGLVLASECIEEPHDHIYYLLGSRYTSPAVSGNLTDSDDEMTEIV
jgi:hypothetical protein